MEQSQATHKIPSGLGGTFNAAFTGLRDKNRMQFIVVHPSSDWDKYLVWCNAEEVKELR
jgi:hypothetical protein